MKIQRMHMSRCSMLVAALVGLLPIAAVQPSLGQERGTATDTTTLDRMGPQGPVRDDTAADEPLPWESDQTRPESDDRGAQGPMRDDAMDLQDSQERDQFGAEGPLQEDTDTIRQREFDEGGAEGPMRSDPEPMPAPQYEYRGGVEGPMRSDAAVVPGTVTYPAYRMYIGETNEFIDPAGIKVIPYREAGVMGPARTDIEPWTYRTYIGENNEFIDPGGVHAYAVERGAMGPLRDADTQHFMNYGGETNPFLDLGGEQVYYHGRDPVYPAVLPRDASQDRIPASPAMPSR